MQTSLEEIVKVENFKEKHAEEIRFKGVRALQEFQSKYPSVTSGDLQTFVLGYQAGMRDSISLCS